MRSLPLACALLASGLLGVGCGDNGKTSAGSGGAGAGGSGGAGGGGAGSTTLSLPQFVHGKAYLDTSAFGVAEIVVDASGAVPDEVDYQVGPIEGKAVKSGASFLVSFPSSTLPAGEQPLWVEAIVGSTHTPKLAATLTVAPGSAQ